MYFSAHDPTTEYGTTFLRGQSIASSQCRSNKPTPDRTSGQILRWRKSQSPVLEETNMIMDYRTYIITDLKP